MSQEEGCYVTCGQVDRLLKLHGEGELRIEERVRSEVLEREFAWTG